jgi:hypothetical protein
MKHVVPLYWDDINKQYVTGAISADGEVHFVSPGHVDTNNSTATTLAGDTGGADHIFTGTATDILDVSAIVINTFSDVASATDGLSIEWSSDGTNWDGDDQFTIPANKQKTFTFQPVARYMRVVYTNGVAAQTAFRLQLILKHTNVKPSSHRIQDPIIEEDDAELVKAVLTGKDPTNVFRNVTTTADGDLLIADNSSGLAIAEGLVSGKTFIHKFGKAPDFDIGDGVVTIWDGANDGLLGGGAMSYTYSSTADIGLISSSSGSDTVDIEIQGLDGTGAIVTQTITLTGQTDVDISGVGGTDLKRVYRMENVGATDLVGVVYLRTNGSTQTAGVPDTANTVRAIINNGNNQTLMAVYTIPTGKTGYMRDWYAATAGANKSSNYGIQVFSRPSGQVFQLKHDSAISDGGSSAYQHDFKEPEIFTAGTDIEMRTQMFAAGGAAAAISGGFDIVLVDD